MHFFDTDYLDASEVPISVDQARLSNERVEQLWLELADDEPAPSPFGIMVDLSTLDMSNWEPTHFIESTVPV